MLRLVGDNSEIHLLCTEMTLEVNANIVVDRLIRTVYVLPFSVETDSSYVCFGTHSSRL